VVLCLAGGPSPDTPAPSSFALPWAEATSRACPQWRCLLPVLDRDLSGRRCGVELDPHHGYVRSYLAHYPRSLLVRGVSWSRSYCASHELVFRLRVASAPRRQPCHRHWQWLAREAPVSGPTVPTSPEIKSRPRRARNPRRWASAGRGRLRNAPKLGVGRALVTLSLLRPFRPARRVSKEHAQNLSMHDARCIQSLTRGPADLSPGPGGHWQPASGPSVTLADRRSPTVTAANVRRA
jgi:hypothetical protein